VFTIKICAQDSIVTNRPFYVTYSLKDGLPSNQIIYLFNDSKGLMWIGTERGLASFDGRDFRIYENDKLNKSLITFIEEDKNGVIWASSEKGHIFFIENGIVYEHPLNEEIRKARWGRMIQGFEIDDEGGLNFAGFNHFYRVTMDSIYTTYSASQKEIVFKQIGSYLLSSLSRTNYDSPKDLYFELQDTSFYYPNKIPKIKGFRSYSTATDSTFALVVFQELFLYENGKMTHLNLPSRPTNSMIFSKDGSFWIGTETRGAFQIKDGEIITNVFPNEKIHSICEDFEGGFWFGMPFSGVRYVSNRAMYLHQNNAPSMTIKYFFTNSDSSLSWITDDGQLFSKNQCLGTILSPNEMVTFQKAVFTDDKSFCFSLSSPNNTPVLYCINRRNSSVSNYSISQLSSLQRIIMESGGDTLIISYADISNLRRKEQFPDPYTKDVVTYRDIVVFQNHIWIASYAGIYKTAYDKSDSVMFKIQELISYEKRWYRLILIKNSLFGITMDGDLYQIDTQNSKITPLNISIGRSLNCLKVVGSNAYLGFSDGVARLNVSKGQNDSDLVDFQYLPVDIKQFNSSIFDLEVARDTMFLACADGIVSVSLSQLQDYSHPGKLSIDELTYKNKSFTDFTKALEFYSGDNINFNITAVQFQNTSDFTYQYRLLPSDTVWHRSKQSELNFFQLPSDSYELQVKLNTGVQRTAKFQIIDRWYQELWFTIVAVIFLTILGFLPFYYRIRLNTVAEKIEREKNNMRISTLNIQLKPHFIFNALNSIQAYMLEQNTAQATSYLARFAKHIRATLEQSREDLIPLSDSLESLENYLVLERMRKYNAFDFEIKVNSEIDLEQIRIPPLLIQPYVENSIIHAFSELKTGGYIIVSVEQLNEEHVSIKVLDNGQGLGSHLQSKPLPENKKKSLGTLINNERIETLNALYSSQFSVTVENAQSGKGVWVEILIPTILSS
jgi:hypothetical protein